MTRAEELLEALTKEAPIDWWRGPECAYCTYCSAEVLWAEDLEDIENHKPDCPWRLAKKYLQGVT